MWPLGLLFSGYLLASYTPLNALKAIEKTNVIILRRKALTDKYVISLIRYDVNKKKTELSISNFDLNILKNIRWGEGYDSGAWDFFAASLLTFLYVCD